MKVHNVIVKLIFTNTKINKEIYYPIKGSLQSMIPYEEYYNEINDNNISDIYDRIIVENNNIDNHFCNLHKTLYKISMSYGGVNQGFINNLVENPYWDLKTYNKILYKGEKLEYLSIDKVYRYIRYNVKIDIEIASKTIISLLAQFRNYIIINKERYDRYHGLVTILCEGLMNVLDNELKEKDSNKKLIKEFYYQMATLISDIKVLANAKIEGQWFERLQKLKFAKSIIKRVKTEFKIDVENLLGTNKNKYLGLKLITTAASEVEPWLIMVDYISTDYFRICDIYNNNETCKEMKDSKNNIITDILPNSDNNKNNKIIYGYTFTRNPYLYIGSQQISLLVVTWVSSIEYIFNMIRNKKKGINLYERIQLTYSLTERVKMGIDKNKNIYELMDKIMEQDNFECYLTESYDILSVCMILGILLVNKEIFKKEKYHRFAFALMSESIMRGCRAYSKSTNKNSDQHIRYIINVNKFTDLDNYEFDMDRAMRITNKFYRKKYTNCTPFALVAVLGFVERFSDFSIRNMLIEFEEGRISMKNFLEKHFPNKDKKETQIALFLQGMKYSKSKYRQNIKFDDPKKIINEIIDEQIKIIKNKQLITIQTENKRQKRYVKRLEDAQEFNIYHISPKLFTWNEVNDLNLNRHKDDKLELLQGRLLKHHCCYPECPQYLENFVTEYDRKHDTRNGLMKHLKYQIILDNYAPSFHLISENIIKNNKLTFEQYIKAMDNYFNKNDRLKKFYKTLRYKEQHFKIVWSFHNKL